MCAWACGGGGGGEEGEEEQGESGRYCEGRRLNVMICQRQSE